MLMTDISRHADAASLKQSLGTETCKPERIGLVIKPITELSRTDTRAGIKRLAPILGQTPLPIQESG